ncbi:hypothetical protein HK105_207919 [Polyrhizophydium stewartii]|uniref:Ankyrin repeat domain containing protein n=1 Tax=Polyrhizophydium stewartii TaxID=2732419 RepID=A0ABR4MZB2_9FUNG
MTGIEQSLLDQATGILARIDAGDAAATAGLDAAAAHAVWAAAFDGEWGGDLAKLPRASGGLPWPVYARIRSREMSDRVAALETAAAASGKDADTSSDGITHAAALAMVAVRRCWLDRIAMTDPDQLVSDAARCGGIELLKALVDDRKLVALHPRHAESAAAGGDVAVLEWFDARLPQCWTAAAMGAAATGGHLAAVEFLHARSAAGCTPAAMDGAATNGHLDVVEFLHERRAEGCTTAAMDGAAGNGHLDIVVFLHDNRTEGCTTAAMDRAAAGGDLRMAEWLYEYRTEGCSPRGVALAAAGGHADMVEWLHVNMSDRFGPGVMDAALRRGRLSIAKWLHLHRADGCSPRALRRAAEGGHADCVRWLLDNVDRVDWDVADALDAVRSDGAAPNSEVFDVIVAFAARRGLPVDPKF